MGLSCDDLKFLHSTPKCGSTVARDFAALASGASLETPTADCQENVEIHFRASPTHTYLVDTPQTLSATHPSQAHPIDMAPPQMAPVYIVSAVRTPIGQFQGYVHETQISTLKYSDI